MDKLTTAVTEIRRKCDLIEALGFNYQPGNIIRIEADEHTVFPPCVVINCDTKPLLLTALRTFGREGWEPIDGFNNRFKRTIDGVEVRLVDVEIPLIDLTTIEEQPQPVS